MNISGLSRDALNAEEVWLYVNGDFYAIQEPGDPHACDVICELTPYGAIAACNGCSVSGWGNTRITGPITTLEVEDSVFIGQPAGGIFSLFVCEGTSGLHDTAGAGQGRPYPNPATDALWIDLPDAQSARVQLFDANGRAIPVGTTFTYNRMHISTEGLAPGVYAVQVEQGSRRTMHRVVIE